MAAAGHFNQIKIRWHYKIRIFSCFKSDMKGFIMIIFLFSTTDKCLLGFWYRSGKLWNYTFWNCSMGLWICSIFYWLNKFKSWPHKIIVESIKDLRIFLWTLLLCVVTSKGWNKGIFGNCTFHIIPFVISRNIFILKPKCLISIPSSSK